MLNSNNTLNPIIATIIANLVNAHANDYRRTRVGQSAEFNFRTTNSRPHSNIYYSTADDSSLKIERNSP